MRTYVSATSIMRLKTRSFVQPFLVAACSTILFLSCNTTYQRAVIDIGTFLSLIENNVEKLHGQAPNPPNNRQPHHAQVRPIIVILRPVQTPQLLNNNKDGWHEDCAQGRSRCRPHHFGPLGSQTHRQS